MAESIHASTSSRAYKRPKGRNLTKAERLKAQETFLQSFRLNANITAACHQAGIDRGTFYTWSEHDENFALCYHQAQEMANDMLLAAAWKRAVQGIEEPVVSMGQQVYGADGRPLMKRIYSDTVLLRLMSWRIAGFRETKGLELSGKDGGPIEFITEWGGGKLAEEEESEV